MIILNEADNSDEINSSRFEDQTPNLNASVASHERTYERALNIDWNQFNKYNRERRGGFNT